MRKYSFYLVIFSLCLLILSGCGKLDRKGTAPTNAAPKVYFANIPPEATYFSVNPPIYWFGTDIDGFIAAYQYGVMVTDSTVSRGGLDQVKSELYQIPPDSVSWMDQTSLKNMIGVHIQAEPGGHSRNVQMFADTVDTIYTPQYVFLRAVDNRGAVSEVISRLYYRNNHRPEAFILKDEASVFVAKNHYCLEETTVTWKGITISWSGLDTADYPDENKQPDFQYKWELVGPFKDSLESPFSPETTKVVASSLDSLLIAGEWHPSRWVSETMHVFKGLENSGDLGYGWYQLRVRARDDAFVSHEIPAYLNFRILKPKFRYDDRERKTILVMDNTLYGGVSGGVRNTGDVWPFYRDALRFLFESELDLCDDYNIWDDLNEDTLSRYDLVIVVNVGSNPGIPPDENYKRYKEYLNVGGRVWFIGLNNFNMPSGRRYHPFEERKTTFPNTYELGTEYFGLDGVFVPTWTSKDATTLEFIQAKPFGLWEGLDTLEADTSECKKLIDYDPADAAFHWGVRGIPWVCYVAMSNRRDFYGRIPAERRIYTFISYYGSPPMHSYPCAVNYIGPTYRTAAFCFPLNLMKNDEQDNYPVFQVMEKMVEWLTKDLPLP